MSEIDRFRKFVKDRGLRYTPEREMIISEIFSVHDHFDVDGLYLRLRRRKRRVSKASIYRTIPLLIESGLIKEVYFEDGHLHYEHIYGHKQHCHFRCVCCGKVVEFPDDEVVKIQNEISQRYGFFTTSHRFELLGYCPECARNEDSSGGTGRSGGNGVIVGKIGQDSMEL
jgi:Fur family ferric uptake transcriptional regulator